jgi:RHS repeat-associated protein
MHDMSSEVILHVMGHGRHAQVERVLAGSDPESSGLFFFHADHLGSGHVLTRENGDLLNQEEYFPYGRASDRRGARNRYRFIGVERDEDTELCMTGPRTYDPVSGRFLQGDPLYGLGEFTSQRRDTDQDREGHRSNRSSPSNDVRSANFLMSFLTITPYHYGENRPLAMIDATGWETIVIISYEKMSGMWSGTHTALLPRRPTWH